MLSFNGGATHTELATWLATNFPNLYGTGAGTHNLTGLTNAGVASLFRSLWRAHDDSLDVQVLATALNVYATTSSLGGTQGAKFGFKVSNTGLGARSLGIGDSGAAFGVANHTKVTVFQLLLDVNKHEAKGVLYNGDRKLQELAKDVFNRLNEVGEAGRDGHADH